MPRLHVVVGYRNTSRSGAPIPLYVGHDADAARRTQDAAASAGVVLMAERFQPSGPVVRYAASLASEEGLQSFLSAQGLAGVPAKADAEAKAKADAEAKAKADAEAKARKSK